MVVRAPQGALARDRAEAASSLLSSSTRMLVAAGDDDPDRLKLYTELAGELLDRASLADRVETASLLADFAPAPRSILRRLARDDWSVAEPILSRAKTFTAVELLGLLAVVPETHAACIARRPGLGDDVALALINRGEVAPTRALLDNPSFKMTGEHAEALAAIGHADPVILAAIGQAPPTAGDESASLFSNLDSAARARVIATLEARRALARPTRSHAARTTVRLDAAMLFALSTRGDWHAIAEQLAKAIGIDVARMEASLNDAGGEPLLVVLRAVGLDAPSAMRMILFHPLIGQDVARVRWLGELNERLTSEGANDLITDWRGRSGDRVAPPPQRVVDTAEGLARPQPRPEPRTTDRRPDRSPADRAIEIIRARLG